MIQQPLPPPVATPPPGVDLDTIIGSLTPLVLGVVALVVAGVVMYRFFKSDLAAALAERLRRRRKSSQPIEGLEAHVAELEQEVVGMRGQITEMAERLDFAERLLAQQKRERALPGA
ncbi:MAG TPA: hypothetical protein VKD28_01545 [Gemmatimonadales bacterium]|nr:hypothetical protein [Gemmatimonadales bacterium]